MSRKPKTTTPSEAAPETPSSKPGPKPMLEPTDAMLRQLKGLGGIMATVEECAAILGVSLRTLQYFFAKHPEAKEAHEAGMELGKISLRRHQFALAEKNANMAMWLGKNYLGQREPVQQIETGKPGDFSSMTDDELDRTLAQGAAELAELDPEFARSMLKSARGSSTKH